MPIESVYSLVGFTVTYTTSHWASRSNDWYS